MKNFKKNINLHETRNATFNSKGFAILFAVLLASFLITLGISIFNISFKEIQITTSLRDSQVAYYAADSARECALYWDVMQGIFPTCFGSDCSSDSDYLPTVSKQITCNGNSKSVDFFKNSSTLTYSTGPNPVADFFRASSTSSSTPAADVSIIKKWDETTKSVKTIADAYGHNTDIIGRRIERGIQQSNNTGDFTSGGSGGGGFAGIPTDNLVGYWKMDEGSGSTVTDSSGNGNSATLGNTTWASSGKINLGLLYDSTTDYLTASTAGWNNGEKGTIMFWLYYNNIPSTTNYLWDIETPRAYCYSSVGSFLYFHMGSVDINITPPDQESGKWYHLAFVWDNSTGVSIYRNGELIGSAPGTWAGTNFSENFNLGTRFSHGQSIENGIVDEVAVYRRTLSADEIKNIYNGQK